MFHRRLVRSVNSRGRVESGAPRSIRVEFQAPSQASEDEGLRGMWHPRCLPTGNRVQVQQELAHERHHRDVARLTAFTPAIIEATHLCLVSNHRPRTQVHRLSNLAPPASPRTTAPLHAAVVRPWRQTNHRSECDMPYQSVLHVPVRQHPARVSAVSQIWHGGRFAAASMRGNGT